MSHKTLHVLIIISLVILGFILLRVLIRHYWLLIFLWLMLPFVGIWLSGDIMRGKLSLEIHKLSHKALIGAAVVLSILNLINFTAVRHDLAKHIVDGYQIVKSYDCEPYEGDWGETGPPPDECFVEDLSRVSGFGKVFLYLIDWCGVILMFVIPAATFLAGQEGLNKKEQEDRDKNA